MNEFASVTVGPSNVRRGAGAVGPEMPDAGPLSEPRAPRVVVSEDDDDFRLALATALRIDGYTVLETRDGQELLDALHAAPSGFFDFVIADHWMPRVSGIECLAQAGGRAPFVILTGVRDTRIEASARRFGAAAVVEKPVDLDALLEVLRGLSRQS